MAQPDLFCAVVKAVSTDAKRGLGYKRRILTFAKVTDGNEQAFIERQLAAHGWKVLKVFGTKQVSSRDSASENDPVMPALTAAREKGFGYVVHSKPL